MSDFLESMMMQREKLSNEIFNLLVTDEDAAIQLWLKNSQYLRNDEFDDTCIDVLTSVYNAEKYVKNAILSVLHQSHQNLRLIVVVDHCTDGTLSILEKIAEDENRIILLTNNSQKGRSNCLNLGLKKCINEYIALIDLDDLIHPLKFEKQLRLIKAQPRVAAVSTWMMSFRAGNLESKIQYREEYESHKVTLLFYSPLSHAASMFRADILKKIGYQSEYTHAEDYYLWYRVMREYRTSVLPEYLYLYRKHENQVTNPANFEIIVNSWRKILLELFTDMKLIANEDEIQFHIKYLMLNQTINESDFPIFHNWIQHLLKANKKSFFFSQEKLKNFLFVNYWQTAFELNSRKISLLNFLTYNFSSINQKSIVGRLKDLVRYLFLKF